MAVLSNSAWEKMHGVCTKSRSQIQGYIQETKACNMQQIACNLRPGLCDLSATQNTVFVHQSPEQKRVAISTVGEVGSNLPEGHLTYKQLLRGFFLCHMLPDMYSHAQRTCRVLAIETNVCNRLESAACACI